MFATDKQARDIPAKAIALGHDHSVAADMYVFFYLPSSTPKRSLIKSSV